MTMLPATAKFVLGSGSGSGSRARHHQRGHAMGPVVDIPLREPLTAPQVIELEWWLESITSRLEGERLDWWPFWGATTKSA
jgi:hypothetical protein